MEIGRYRVDGELGRGGAGTVYRAWDPDLGVPVAIKVLHSQDEESTRRFQREIDALGQIDHPHLMSVRESGKHQGRSYLVMDLIEGESLSVLLERGGALDERKAVELLRTLALAMHAAHEQGVLHRDLKPDNVLVDRQGAPVVTDFGLARPVDANDPTALTRTGVILGTPGWWAPEQVRGRKELVGPGVDVYGLGGILYACLTGLPPFRRFGSLPEALLATCKNPPVPPSRERPGLDRRLDAICLRCLEKDPGDRYASATELAAALDAVLQHAPSKLSPGVFVAGGLVLVGVLASAGVLVWARSKPTAVAAATSLSEPTSPQRTTPPPVATPSASRRADPSEIAAGLRAATRLAREGRYRDAVVAQSRVIELAPGRAELYVDRGIYSHFQVDLASALADFDRALELDPDNVEGHFRRGNVLRDLGRHEEADASLTRAIDAEPESPGFVVNRGNSRFDQGRYQEALKDYGAALELDPQSTMAWTNRANTLRKLERFEEALRDHDHAVGIDPDPWSLISRARTHRAMGNRSAAIRDLGQAGQRVPPGHDFEFTIQQELALMSE